MLLQAGKRTLQQLAGAGAKGYHPPVSGGGSFQLPRYLSSSPPIGEDGPEAVSGKKHGADLATVKHGGTTVQVGKGEAIGGLTGGKAEGTMVSGKVEGKIGESFSAYGGFNLWKAKALLSPVGGDLGASPLELQAGLKYKGKNGTELGMEGSYSPIALSPEEGLEINKFKGKMNFQRRNKAGKLINDVLSTSLPWYSRETIPEDPPPSSPIAVTGASLKPPTEAPAPRHLGLSPELDAYHSEEVELVKEGMSHISDRGE